MNDQDLPIDESARVVTFPCFIVSNANGSGFVCSDLAEVGCIAVGVQLIFASFLIGILRLHRTR